jgi:hypothetical protein
VRHGAQARDTQPPEASLEGFEDLNAELTLVSGSYKGSMAKTKNGMSRLRVSEVPQMVEVETKN